MQEELPPGKLYYRHDHPNGFHFADAAACPDPSEGWVDDPSMIVPVSKAYEHDTMDSFQEALKAEREGSQKLIANFNVVKAENDALKADRHRQDETISLLQSLLQQARQSLSGAN